MAALKGPADGDSYVINRHTRSGGGETGTCMSFRQLVRDSGEIEIPGWIYELVA